MIKKRKKDIFFVISILFIAVGVKFIFNIEMPSVLTEVLQPGYENITFSDSRVQCEKRLRRHFGKMMTQFVYDQFSSRFDGKEMSYKNYFRAYTGSKSTEIEHFMVCHVSQKSGRIVDFEEILRKEASSGPKKEIYIKPRRHGE